jgi:ABC-type nitrate/sulfonate/bicarbonate transport system substrate-binding protein
MRREVPHACRADCAYRKSIAGSQEEPPSDKRHWQNSDSIFNYLTLTLAATAQHNAITLGYSGGTGLTTDLRRVIEKERIWERYGLSVKAIYFNSGSLMAQAMAGGSITAADSDLPAMLNLAVSGMSDMKTIAVTINRLEHIFVSRKNITKPEELKGKRLAVSRLGSASDFVTRMVLRTWKVDPEKEVTCCKRATHRRA